MRYFHLLNLQHIILWVLPTLVFILVLAVGLAFSHLQTDRSKERMKRIIYTYPGGIGDRNAPFPWIMLLIIIGTVIWGLGYILGVGLLGVKI